jgi:heat shock protein HtpX
MAMIRRIGFFLALNVVVVLTLSLVTNLLGLGPMITRQGMNYGSLIAFCLVWGMGGSLISLMLSKMMAKWSMGVKVIDPATYDAQERELIQTVHRMARAAGITKMPEVGYYESPEVNAFATGPSKNNSLVAVSTGLLRNMDSKSVEGVLGHEISHITNGDMVTMVLLQGVVNAFVMAIARIVAFAIDNALRGDRDRGGGGLGTFGYIGVVFVLELLLFIPGSFIIGWFSRQREYRADAGGARLAGREKMISALRSLQRLSEVNDAASRQPQGQQQAAIASLKISGHGGGLLSALRSTHPPLEKRIEALERGTFSK